jgi:hypothetical protein
MAIVPPNPGRALQLAKDYGYSELSKGFVRGDGAVRWLYPEGGREWVASATPEREVSKETYDLLRAGDQFRDTPMFRVGDAYYFLVDDGFEAKAEPA